MSERPNFRPIAEHAAAMIAAGNVVGLGTGRAATAFIHVLGERVRAGLRMRGLPTSQESANLARTLGIPLTSFEETDTLDLAVDGADEVDPQGNMIKGYGAALVREKIVAAAARRLVILVGPEKLVAKLGARGLLPVEVVPFGQAQCSRRLAALGFPAQPRLRDGAQLVSDNGNPILDCRVPPLDNPAEVEQAIRAIPGVVGTGLFLGMAPTVLIQRENKVEVQNGK